MWMTLFSSGGYPKSIVRWLCIAVSEILAVMRVRVLDWVMKSAPVTFVLVT
jgi:hypothetical protein